MQAESRRTADGHATGPGGAGDQDRAPTGALRRAERDRQPSGSPTSRPTRSCSRRPRPPRWWAASRSRSTRTTGCRCRSRCSPRASTRRRSSAGFTSISFGPVDPSMFEFTPPAGATVTTTTALPTGGQHAERAGEHARHQKPLTFGSGFDTVIAYRPDVAAARARSPRSFRTRARSHPRPWSTRVRAPGCWPGAVPVSELNATAAQLP